MTKKKKDSRHSGAFIAGSKINEKPSVKMSKPDPISLFFHHCYFTSVSVTRSELWKVSRCIKIGVVLVAKFNMAPHGKIELLIYVRGHQRGVRGHLVALKDHRSSLQACLPQPQATIPPNLPSTTVRQRSRNHPPMSMDLCGVDPFWPPDEKSLDTPRLCL